MVRDLLVEGADPEQHRGVAAATGSRHLAANEDGVEVPEAGGAFHDREPVFVGQGDFTSSEVRVLKVLPWEDHDVGDADTLELSRNHVVETLHDGNHRDDRGNSDDDPEHG